MGTTISGSSEAAGNPASDYSVLSLNRRVGDLLDTAFPYPIWLRGELASTPRTNSSGHTYFQLVERTDDRTGQPVASIDCALFASSRNAAVREFARQGLVLSLSEGTEVRIQGRVTLWDKGGRYQFIVQRVDPTWTMGEQAARLRQLVDALSKEGVLAANGELPMPRAPLNVGLVTSRGSAACEDFLHGLRASGFPFRVFAAWAPMQGEGTAQGVMRAFNALLSIPGLDVAVLTRGGGSATDLGWFDDERIARTISQLPWPVISGIGHETDSTLPDFAAHTRAKTPTHAADILVDRTADILDELGALAVLLDRSVARSFGGERVRLASLAESFARSAGMTCRGRLRELRSTAAWLSSHVSGRMGSLGRNLLRTGEMLGRERAAATLSRRRAELASLSRSLDSGSSSRLSRSGMLLDRFAEVVRCSDPARLYASGWATVTAASGKSIRSIHQVGTGDPISVRVLDGSIESIVKGTVDGADPHGSLFRPEKDPYE